MTKKQKIYLVKCLVRKAVKWLAGLAMFAGFILVFLASNTEEMRLIIKLGAIGLPLMLFGLIVFYFIDRYEQELKQRAIERKRRRAQARKMFIEIENNQGHDVTRRTTME